MKKTLLALSIIAALSGNALVLANEDLDHKAEANNMDVGFSMGGEEEHGHNESEHGGHEEDEGESEGGVELSKAQLSAAGIVVTPIGKQSILQIIAAPGEVFFNAYSAKKITPRISAQIIKRHKRLGQFAKKGDTLVSLSSVEMAQAQGDLIVADREWSRVKKLGNKVVSDRRFVETQIARQQAYAKVLAFGMTKSQIKQLLKSKDLSKAVGQFNLLATQNGTITDDNFIEGEIIQPGRVLFEISDETSMWVEARLTPNVAQQIIVGAPATILVNNKSYPAKVTQIHHKLDEATRTIAIRMEVDNLNDSLHPGLFVEARIQSANKAFALALPETAVLRNPDGDWAIFVEEKPGHFKPQEIEVLGKSGNLIIIGGVKENTPVVTKGAFFVQSEIAKSGFSVHNH